MATAGFQPVDAVALVKDDERKLVDAADDQPSALEAVPTAAQCGLGSHLKRTHFLLNEHTAFCNHGSFGAVPRFVLNRQLVRIRQVESFPDWYFRITDYPAQRRVLERVAPWVGQCDPKDLVFVQNATAGMQAVISSQKFQQGDVIVAYSTTYFAVKQQFEHIAERTGAIYHEIQLEMPLQDERVLLESLQHVLEKYGDRVKFVAVDWIMSPAALVYPFREAGKMCQERGIPIVVDGAHSIGQIDITPADMQHIDYLVTNIHKWAFAPKGCAVLWARPSAQADLHPVVTSHFFRKSFNERFFMQGTRDNSSYLVAGDALDWYEHMGVRAIQTYNRDLADWAQSYLRTRWATVDYHLFPASLASPFLRVIKMPFDIPASDVERTVLLFNREYDVSVALLVYSDRLWCRISVQAYNSRSDYERLCDAVLFHQHRYSLRLHSS